MTRSKMKLVLLIPAFTVLLVLNLNAQTYKLKYSFQKGKTYKYKNELSGDMTQQAMGQEIKATNSGVMASKFVVDDVDKQGNMILIVSLDSGQVTTKAQMNEKTTSLENLANKRTKAFLAPDGKIVKTEVIDTIKAGLEAMGMTQKSFMQFARLPEKEIKMGENWNITDTDTMEMGGGKLFNTSNVTYTLAGQEKIMGHNCLKLTFNGDVKNTGKAKIMGMEFFLEGSGKTSGTVYFDAENGIVVSTEGLTNNEMTMATTGEQNMIIPITQSMKMTQTLLTD